MTPPQSIIECLATGPLAVTDLAARLPISRPVVSQHLKVLAEAGLVGHRAVGTRPSTRHPGTTMTSGSPTSIRTTVTVEVSRDHAFSVFTERFDSWWPRSHYSGPDELAASTMRDTFGSDDGWTGLIKGFAQRAEATASIMDTRH